MTSKAVKNDGDYIEKPPMELLPQESLLEVARVLGFGAKKYNRGNWRKGMNHTRLAAAALRHITQYLGGQDKDPESKLEHIAHAICGLMMLLESRKKGYGKDDRDEI